MDWWRMAELGLPLLVTILLAWAAVYVETKRSRRDRREAWRYERNRVAVEAVIERMRQASDLAKECIAATSIDAKLRQNLNDAVGAAISLENSWTLPHYDRLEYGTLVKQIPGDYIFEANGGTISESQKLAIVGEWCESLIILNAAVEHSLSEAWAHNGEKWSKWLKSEGAAEKYLRKKGQG